MELPTIILLKPHKEFYSHFTDKEMESSHPSLWSDSEVT